MHRYKILLAALLWMLLLVTCLAQQTPVPQTPSEINIYSFDPLLTTDQDVSSYPEQAYKLYQEGKFDQAAQYYLAYLAKNPDDANSWYNLSCCFGLLGSAKEAGKYLKIAYKKGFTDLEHIKQDKDFDLVKGAKTFTQDLDSLQTWYEKDSSSKGKMGYFPIRQLEHYYIYMPQNYDPQKSYALLIGMHGFGDTAQGFNGLWSLLQNKDVIYVVPEAPYAFPESKNSAFSWNPFVAMDSKYMEKSFDWVNAYITGLTMQLKKEYRIKETWLLGFSQGAYFGYLLALKNPTVFDGLVACGGGLMKDIVSKGEYKKAKNLKVIISHGRQDNVVPYSEAENAYNILLQKKVPVTMIPFEGEHRVSKTALDAFVEEIK